MYKHDCGAQHGIPDFACLSTVGWTVSIACTYAGYICMIVGMLWAVDIKQKIVMAYREIRRAQRAKEQVQSETNPEEPLLESSTV